MKTEVSIILLHEHPEYLNECAVLLSKQWKRSLSARIQSIEKSYKDLPDSVLLLEEVEGKKEVIGHSRLTRVLEDPQGCWIGSVVVSEDKRGLGYGKYLMRETEEYAKLFDFTTVYLNTKDKQGFYEHLGYTYGEPVSMVASKFNPLANKGSLHPVFQRRTEKIIQANAQNIHSPNISKSSDATDEIVSAPPPPPPPMPKSKVTSTNNVISNLGQYWMKKTL